MKNWILLTGPGLFNFDDIHQPPEGFFTQVQTFPTLVVSIRTQPAARFVPIQNIQWRLTPRWSTSIVMHDKLAKNHISIVHTRDASKHLPLGKHFSAIDFDTTQFTYEGRTHQEVNLGNKWTGRWKWSTNYFLLGWSSKLSEKEPQENRKQKISTFVTRFVFHQKIKFIYMHESICKIFYQSETRFHRTLLVQLAVLLCLTLFAWCSADWSVGFQRPWLVHFNRRFLPGLFLQRLPSNWPSLRWVIDRGHL